MSEPIRRYTLSQDIEEFIVKQLSHYSLKLTDATKIADAVKRLSDFYIQSPDQPTPWDKPWCQIAYISYFYPLNILRAKAVTEEGNKFSFFNDLEHLIDYGAGLGSGSYFLDQFQNKLFIETAKVPRKILGEKNIHWLENIENSIAAKTLGVFSYSLTEQHQLPLWAYDCEALMIIEPATQTDGRRLLSLRNKLLEQSFQVFAPCTHQGDCPLLTKSKTDWCHDRIHFAQPKWFLELEKHLPFKNKTITMSYLLVRKSRPNILANYIRTTGDQLKEKGKTRQLICRGPDREFLTWLERDGITPEIPRGSLIEMPQNIELKGNEIRIRKRSLL